MQVLQGKTQKVTVLHTRKSITRSSVESLTIYSLKLADGVSTFITNRVNNKHVILLQTHSRELWAVSLFIPVCLQLMYSFVTMSIQPTI